MSCTAEYYRDFYGCTASIKTRRNGTAQLTVRLPNGDLYIRRPYSTYSGARIALGKISEGTARLTGKEEN